MRRDNVVQSSRQSRLEVQAAVISYPIHLMSTNREQIVYRTMVVTFRVPPINKIANIEIRPKKDTYNITVHLLKTLKHHPTNK